MSTDKVLEARKAHASLRKKLNKCIVAAGFVWNNESEREIEAVTSLEEAIKSYKRAPRGYPAKEAAMKKWVDLCTTPLDVSFAYHSTNRSFFNFWYIDDEDCGYGIHRWMQLSSQIINSATTLEGLLKAVRRDNRIPNESWEEVVKKALMLCTESSQVMRVVWCELGNCRPFEKLLLIRRNELYEKERGEPHPYPDRL